MSVEYLRRPRQRVLTASVVSAVKKAGGGGGGRKVPPASSSVGISYLAAGTNTVAGAGTSMSVPKPAGMTTSGVKSYMLLEVGTQQPATTAMTVTVTGWTLIARYPDSGSTHETWLFGKFADAADGASFSVTSTSGASLRAGRIYAFDGVNQTTPVDTAVGSRSTGQCTSALSCVVPSVTPEGTGRMLVLWGYWDAVASSITATAPAGMTGVAPAFDTGQTHIVALAYQSLPDGAATGTRTVTFSNSAHGRHGLVCLRPA